MSKNLKLFGIVLVMGMMTFFSGRVEAGKAKGKVVGGPCHYTVIPGTCRITSVKNAAPDQNNCQNDPVEVLFDFTPKNKKAPDDYRLPAWKDKNQHLVLPGGRNPPRKWVEQQGLKQGATKNCQRTEITQGTCAPVIFKILDVDFSTANDLCSGP
jgi:hypothetical protein